MNHNAKAYVAEFVGTFILVFVGSGAVWAASQAGYAAGPIVPAFAHGLAVVLGAYALGAISGGHFNPAVSIGLAIARAISWGKALVYCLVQLVAGVVAAGVLAFVLPNQAANFGAFKSTVGFAPTLLMEAVLTFILVSTVLNAAVSGRAGNFAGLAIGFSLAASILAGGAVTGASLNPARTLGPAIVAGDLSQVPAYLIGAILGAVIAALLYRFVLSTPTIAEPISSKKITDRQYSH